MRRKHDWLRETYRKSLEKIPERPVAHRTLSNIAPDPLYTPEDIGVLDPEYEEKRGFPGSSPTPGGSTAPCTGPNSGPCACSPASAPPSRRTSASRSS